MKRKKCLSQSYSKQEWRQIPSDVLKARSNIQKHQTFCDFCDCCVKIQEWHDFCPTQILTVQISRFPLWLIEEDKLFFGIIGLLLKKLSKLARWENWKPSLDKDDLEQTAQGVSIFNAQILMRIVPFLVQKPNFLTGSNFTRWNGLLLLLCSPFPWCYIIIHGVIILHFITN